MAQVNNGNKGRSVTKQLQEELELLNKRGKSKPVCTIENAATFQDLGSSTGRDELFKLVKELYSFSKRAIEQVKIKEDGQGGSCGVNSGQIGDMIKTELASVLPEMLKTALNDLKKQDDGPALPCSQEKPEENQSHITTGKDNR